LLQQTIEVQNSRMNYFCSAPWRMKNKKIQTVEFCWLGITWNHLESGSSFVIGAGTFAVGILGEVNDLVQVHTRKIEVSQLPEKRNTEWVEWVVCSCIL
jgi:hypothetical protein